MARRQPRWIALDAVEDLQEPDDLTTVLDANPAARESWDGFPRSTKSGILEWIISASRPDTRARRIAETVSESSEGRRANQWPRR